MPDDQIGLDAGQRVVLSKFLAGQPGAVFLPFEEVAVGALTGCPPIEGAFWTVSTTGSLITVGGRK